MRIGVIFRCSQDRGKRTKNRARRRLGRRPGISEIARHGKLNGVILHGLQGTFLRFRVLVLLK